MSLHLEESRTVPGSQEHVYDAAITTALPTIFRHRHVVMPPVKATSGEDGVWGERVGQSRTIHLADGGSVKETLTLSERPSRSEYSITELRGPLKLLVSHAEGAWRFEPAGADHTSVTWAWTLHPTNGVTARLLPVIGVFWRGYATKALAEVERVATSG